MNGGAERGEMHYAAPIEAVLGGPFRCFYRQQGLECRGRNEGSTGMSEAGRGGIWSRVPVMVRAVVIGIVVGLAAAIATGSVSPAFRSSH